MNESDHLIQLQRLCREIEERATELAECIAAIRAELRIAQSPENSISIKSINEFSGMLKNTLYRCGISTVAELRERRSQLEQEGVRLLGQRSFTIIDAYLGGQQVPQELVLWADVPNQYRVTMDDLKRAYHPRKVPNRYVERLNRIEKPVCAAAVRDRTYDVSTLNHPVYFPCMSNNLAHGSNFCGNHYRVASLLGLVA